MILIYIILFFSNLVCQLLASAENKEISNENNLASKPAIYDENDMEEILKELSQCRDNKINDQTMSDILEEMATLKEYILRSEKKIESLTSAVWKQEAKIEDSLQRLGDISTRGRWCGYQDHWTANLSIITYTSLTFSDTNMDLSETPFDINSGKS